MAGGGGVIIRGLLQDGPCAGLDLDPERRRWPRFILDEGLGDAHGQFFFATGWRCRRLVGKLDRQIELPRKVDSHAARLLDLLQARWAAD